MEAPIMTSGRLSKLRDGKFTASIWGDVMTKDRSGEGMGKTAKSAIAKVAWERMSGRPTQTPTNADMRRGNTLEPVAFTLLDKHWTPLLKYYPNEGFIPFRDNAGATPDGFAFDGAATVDIKCPAVGGKLLQFATEVPDGDLPALKKWDSGYYWQILFQAMCAGVDRCYLVYFDERWPMIEADVDEFRDIEDTEFSDQGGFAFVARGFTLTEELKKEMLTTLEAAEVECKNIMYRLKQTSLQTA